MSPAWSNILAVVAVTILPLGGIRIAPKLTVVSRRFFFVLTVWGAPFLVGQFAQYDEWGALWVQYHLLDFAYVPWGVALVMLLLFMGTLMLGKELPSAALFVCSLGAVLLFGYGTELWDTAWAWYGNASLWEAIDIGDYYAITLGAAVTAATYVWVWRLVAADAAS